MKISTRTDFETAIVAFAVATLILWIAAIARFASMSRRIDLLEDDLRTLSARPTTFFVVEPDAPVLQNVRYP